MPSAEIPTTADLTKSISINLNTDLTIQNLVSSQMSPLTYNAGLGSGQIGLKPIDLGQPIAASMMSGLYGSVDAVESGLSLYSGALSVGMNNLKVAGTDTAYLGVKYGLPSLLADVPAGVGGGIAIGQAYQAYKEGHIKEAGEKSISALAGIVGTELGAAAVEAGLVTFVAAPVVVPIAVGVTLSLGAFFAYREYMAHAHPDIKS